MKTKEEIQENIKQLELEYITTYDKACNESRPISTHLFGMATISSFKLKH